MTPIIPCSISNVAFVPGTTFVSGKNNCLTRYNFSGKSRKQILATQSFLLPLAASVRLFPKYRNGHAVHHEARANILAATGTEVAVEETSSTASGNDADGNSEIQSNAVETNEAPSSKTDSSVIPSSQSKRSRPARRSEMPPVKNEELVPGATFTGKVRSIQPFGAFVDFRAFTDGLVHVSRISDSFVKDVGSVVSVGQEVKVRLVEANTETGRISLTMRESDDINKMQQQKDAPASNDKPRPARRNQKRVEGQKSSKFVKGQDLAGTVKNLTRAGAFISLPEGEEGFLPTSEEPDEGFVSMMGGSSLQAGQEVNVRVLRITRGQVTLTMKKEEDVEELKSKLNQGVVHTATNPFLLAFRQNKDIATFLDEREKLQELVETSSQSVDVADDTIPKVEASPETRIPEGSMSSDTQIIDEAPVTDSVKEDGKSDPAEKMGGDQILSSGSVVDEKVGEEQAENAIVKDELQTEVPSPIDKTSSEEAAASTVDAPSTELISDDENSESAVSDSSESVDVRDEAVQEKEASPENRIPEESIFSEKQIVEAPVTNEGQADNAIVKDEMQTEALSTVEDEIESGTPDENEKLEPVPEKNGSVTTSNEETVIPSSQESASKATISLALVKQLREETGAGMMDCKKALAETEGDIVKAQQFLRKKGLASADKKASRATAEGRIGSYIHDGRIGILIEVNCETDFVSRGDIFKELVDDLAMQAAACPQVQYLVMDNVPEEIVNKEKEIEMQKEDLQSKPEQIRSKIIEGRIRKRVEELALLEQPYIKNDKVVVKDWLKQTIATIAENIKVKRFVRYNLGEGLEKKSQDFAAEVAAQTAAMQPPVSGKEQAVAVEAKETIEKSTVTISALLVKQLREETGAGMMDCKKALSETRGDLEKAQEYLRKKGLSTADKKSGRLAAEGRIGSYIHDSRIGVLIEVNCETDFVGRSEKFKELVDDLAMQAVACPQVQFVSIQEIPESIVSKEKEVEMQREDLLSKPEIIREKIVEGRISKRLGELALLEQPFIKNDGILVKDLVKQTVAALGENIKVRRFVRFTLGEVTGDAKSTTEA